ncbi:PKD domain-containing protein [Naasia sp. SYSU D00057]|uniref:PKD domain-containing protein n=1 Tax=Naasia sp. SYSU D00057 TaxID=2817380 RepID=UPI001B310E5A|nr:PKD domain-containing protein [Naasia sp. SYSU D00057]
MSSRITARTRALAAILAILALVTGAAFTSGAAYADTAPASGVPETVSTDVLPTAQIDGIVWSTAIVGTTVYAGGSFSYARPAGAAAGSNQQRRYNLMAFSLTTGQMTSFAPNVNGTINSVSASPDGTRLYIGGTFTQVNGQARNRVAAFSIPGGTLVSGFAPSVNSTVEAVRATNSTVYIGGNFTAVGGTTRTRVAALSASNGAVTSFNARAEGGRVLALAISPTADKVVVGGHFTTLNGSNNPGLGMGALNASTGASMTWRVNSIIRQGGDNAAIYSLQSDSSGVYGTAYIFPFGGQTLEGAFRADWANGDLVWMEACAGDSYDAAPSANVVYVAGHPHDCSSMGAFADQDPRVYQRGMAWSKAQTGTVRSGIWSGRPAPTLLNWWPDFNTGTVSGASQGPWSVAASGNYVVYAGEFTRVNNVGQQGLVRFATDTIAPNDDGPRVTGANFAPTLSSPAAGQVRVNWTANYDRDNEFLTYEVQRDGVTVNTQTAGSRIWYQRPALTYLDTGVSSGSHSYRVRVTDPFGNVVTGNAVSISVTGGTGGGGGGGGTTGTASDNFNRTVSGGWGSATAGGAWTPSSSTSSYYSVNGTTGRLTLPAARTAESYLTGVTSSSANVTASVSVGAVPAGGSVFASVIGRRAGTADYRARVVIASGGAVTLQLQRSGTTLTSANTGLTAAANTPLQVRLQVTGASPTTIRAKVWRAGTTEPTAWTVTTTDSTSGLQTAGHTGLGGYVGSGVTNGPAVIAFDDFALTAP